MQYQFNRESITSAYVKCARTPAGRQEAAEQLAAALAACNVKPTVVPGFTEPAPRPLRSRKVDPETRLQRARHQVPKKVAEDFAKHRQAEQDKAKIAEMVEALS
ncbi:hypothetical protein MAJJADAN_00052 [Pseudomonas phage Amjad_SA]|nr:hypothetical protein MAJJADAN_00052 [Pseudomonas phage Amjad_SA]